MFASTSVNPASMNPTHDDDLDREAYRAWVIAYYYKHIMLRTLY